MTYKISFAGELVTVFLKLLNAQNIRYAVLRNYEGLPKRNKSKDVDILFEPSKINLVQKILFECASRIGYQLIWTNSLDYLIGFVFVKVGDIVKTVKIDLFIGFRWRGIEYLNAKEIISKRKKYKNIFILDSIDESIASYFYYCLYAKEIRSKYHDNIIKNFKSPKVLFRLNKIFNYNYNKELIKDIISDIDGSIKKHRKKIIIKLFFKSLGLKYLSRFFKHLYTEYILRIKFGYFISFSGPDGVGKSTLVDVLNKILFEVGITDKKIPDHLLSENAPALHRSIFAKKSRSNQAYNKPYASKPVSYFESFFRTCYYFVIFVYDGFLIFKRKRNNNIVIYDRYIMDFAVDTRRMRIKMPEILSTLFLKLLNFDNFNILIIAEVNQILERKDELDKNQLDYLLSRYINLSNLSESSIIFSNSKGLEQSQKDFLGLIFNKLNSHYSNY